MHIKDQIITELAATGWAARGPDFTKRIIGFAPSGAVSASGARVVTLRVDETGRWFERIGAWGDVERDVDLRNYWGDPKGAIAAVLS